MVPEKGFNSDEKSGDESGRPQQSTKQSHEGGASIDEKKIDEVKPRRARGLAAADPETRKQVAKKGGEAVSRNRKNMADIGRKGGEAVSQDRKHMASIGRKGGEAVSQNREHMAEIGRKGGEARGSRGENEPEHELPEVNDSEKKAS